MTTYIEHAKKIDKNTGNQDWQCAHYKEKKNVAVDFEICDHVKPTLIEWIQSSGNLVFDVKIDFNQNA